MTPTITAAGALLPPTLARVTVTEQHGRLVLSLWCKTYSQRQAMIEDLRQTFPTHSDRCWRQKQGVWSFPLKHKEKLYSWASAWLQHDAIAWDAEPGYDARHPRVMEIDR